MDRVSPEDSPRKTPRWARAQGLFAQWLPFLTMLLLLSAARDSLANHYQVPSGSMEPTLMPGDRVAVDMMSYGLRVPFTSIEILRGEDPKPGEVVVFKSPADGTRLIKRVVAVGGDRVELSDGRLRINGVPVQIHSDRIDSEGDVERIGLHVATLNLRDGGGPDIPPTVVPEGMALVLGDHRGNSADGRYFGWVPMSSLYGKAVAVYYRSGEGFMWKRL